MSGIPFEQALAAPKAKMLAWRIASPEPGLRLLSVFSLEGEGPEQVAWKRVAEDDVAQVTAELKAAGYTVGAYSDFTDFVWAVEPEGVTVWGKELHAEAAGLYNERRLWATGQQITLGDGRILARDAITTIIGYVDADYLGRGIRAELEGGERVVLIEELAWNAVANPEYDRFEMMMDTDWVGEIAQVLGNWVGCPYVLQGALGGVHLPEQSGARPPTGHVGEWGYHDDDCLCMTAGPGFCNRGGSVWSCCGAVDEDSGCAGSGHTHHTAVSGRSDRKSACLCHVCVPL